MHKRALAIVAGLAVSTGAYADAVFQFDGPAVLSSGESVTLFSGTLAGTATGFEYSFVFGNQTFDQSYASDMQITITAANGNSVQISGYDSVPDIYPSYAGPMSISPGMYGDTIDLSSFGLAGAGVWTVTLTNDWLADPYPNSVKYFKGTLTGSVAPASGVAVPVPGALSLGVFGLTGVVAARRRR